MKLVIDRFEGDFAIVERSDGITVQIPRTVIPQEAKEGDILSINIEEKETKARKATIQNKMNRLFQD